MEGDEHHIDHLLNHGEMDTFRKCSNSLNTSGLLQTGKLWTTNTTFTLPTTRFMVLSSHSSIGGLQLDGPIESSTYQW
jgi:hypothetical protein